MEILSLEQLNSLSVEEILKVISNIRRNVSLVKNKMEAPIYDNIEKYDERMCFINDMRAYLNRAVKVLKEKGGNYVKTPKEKREEEFNKSLVNVSKIFFSFDGPAYSDDSVIVDLSVEPPIILRAEGKDIKESKHKWTKETFLKDFKKLHVGEWDDEYSLSRFGLKNIGGSHWQLIIEYENGKRKIMRGVCAYPYNFDEILHLFKIG